MQIFWINEIVSGGASHNATEMILETTSVGPVIIDFMDEHGVAMTRVIMFGFGSGNGWP